MARRRISGSRVIVTGASSGIGRALVLELARRGAFVIATARREDRLADLAREAELLPGRVQTVAGDIASDATRQRLVELAREQWNGIDVLVNNAGVGAIRNFDRSSPDELRQVMEVNFFAAVELIRGALPLLQKEQSPLIVNIASILGHRGIPHYTEYCASKFALVGFSEALRAELVNQGIEVLIVSPGTTKTEFFGSLLAEQPGVGSRGAGGVPPEAVARAIVRAIERGKHQIVPNPQGRLLLWLNRISPRLADSLVARFG